MPELLGAAWKIVNRGDDYIKMLQVCSVLSLDIIL